MFKKSFFHRNIARVAVSVFFICTVVSGNLFAGNVNLAWDASSSQDVAGYMLYYGNASKNYASSVNVGNKTSYQLAGLKDGGTYYFSVKAYNTGQTVESALSNEVSVAIPAFTTNFSVSKTSGTAPLIVTFTPAENAQVTAWKWDYGTAAIPSSTAKISTVTFSTPGTYSVKLTVTGIGGVTATATKSITVFAAPSPTKPPVQPPTPTPVACVPSTGTTGLVAAYRFEEISGSKAVDSSGNGNHGMIIEAIRTPGKYNSGLTFDGINDWVTIPDSNSLDLTNCMTLEAWVNPGVLPSSWKTVLMKEQVGQQVYSLNANSDSNQPAAISWVNNAENLISGSSQLMPSNWTHLAATYDGKNQALYVDGSLVASKSQTGPILASDGALRIGGNSIWGEFFQGQIDEVRIYSKALSLNDIQKDMVTPIHKSNPPKLVIGQNQMESFVDSSVKGVAVAYRTTPQNDAAMTSISAYLDASSPTSTELVAGIYSDNNGHPGTLLAQGKMTTAKAGETNKVYVPAVMLVARKPYWIALLGPQSEIRFLDRKSTATVPMEKSDAKMALTTLPDTWPVGTAYPNDGPMSIYGNGY